MLYTRPACPPTKQRKAKHKQIKRAILPPIHVCITLEQMKSRWDGVISSNTCLAHNYLISQFPTFAKDWTSCRHGQNIFALFVDVIERLGPPSRCPHTTQWDKSAWTKHCANVIESCSLVLCRTTDGSVLHPVQWMPVLWRRSANSSIYLYCVRMWFFVCMAWTPHTTHQFLPHSSPLFSCAFHSIKAKKEIYSGSIVSRLKSRIVDPCPPLNWLFPNKTDH